MTLNHLKEQGSERVTDLDDAVSCFEHHRAGYGDEKEAERSREELVELRRRSDMHEELVTMLESCETFLKNQYLGYLTHNDLHLHVLRIQRTLKEAKGGQPDGSDHKDGTIEE